MRENFLQLKLEALSDKYPLPTKTPGYKGTAKDNAIWRP